MFNVSNLEDRIKLIKHCESDEIRELKNESIKDFDIYKNKLTKHVKMFLEKVRAPKNVAKMLMVDDIGVCKRTINQKASIYRKAPTREFSGVNLRQAEVLNHVLQDMKANVKGKFANRYFKLQKQALTQIVPKGGKLVKKVLKRHEYTLISDPNSPEDFAIVVIHNFNQPKEKGLQRYVVWTSDYNFTMDGHGTILTEESDLTNPIAPLLPFTEYALEKDGDVYVDEKETSVSFTLKLNAMLTEVYHIMRMQGFGQPVLVGSKKSFPNVKEIDAGVDDIMVLITDPDGGQVDFKFVTANPDLAGNIDTLGVLLSAWLSSEGLDLDSVKFRGDGNKTYSSGFERLLALIEKFEATGDDMEVFKDGEKNEFKIITKYLEVLSDDREQLNPKYSTGNFSEDAELNIEFAKPEEIQTRPEKIQMLKEMENFGYGSLVTALKELKGFKSDEEALEFIETLKEHRQKVLEIVDEQEVEVGEISENV